MSIEDTLSALIAVESCPVSQNMKKTRTSPFLYEDILANILSRLPRKSLARLTCVSKPWLTFISNHIRAKPPNFRLICRFGHELRLLRIDENGDAAIDNDLVIQPSKPWLLVDSCNGMLLCSKRIGNSRTLLSVWNLITKQWVDIAEPRNWGISTPDYSNSELPNAEVFSLAAYDECHFKVIRIFSAFGHATLEKFSSDTGEWSDCKAVVSLPSPRILRHLISLSKSLFLKGALHWVCLNYMLVYHINTDLCSFIELPKLSRDNVNLWEVRGRLICCLHDKNGFQIWDHKEDDQSSKWELKHDVELATLIKEYPEIFAGFNEWRKRWLIVLWPKTFNEDLQCLYLNLPPGRVASYNLQTKTFKVIYSFAGETGCVYPFRMFPMVCKDP